MERTYRPLGVRDIPTKWVAGGAPIIPFCRHHGPHCPASAGVNSGGGEYLAYCVPTRTITCSHIALWRVGATKAIMVPGSSSGQDSKVAIAPVPGRKLWVLWFDVKSGHIQLVETNATATGVRASADARPAAAPVHFRGPGG